MKEVYKAVPGWSNYIVSNFGDVKSIDRVEDFKNSTRIRKGRTISQRVLLKYSTVRLKQKPADKMCVVHRLVAEAFIPNPKNYPVVNHIDNNSLNNRVDNLEWCTQAMNIAHAMKFDTWTRGVNNGNSKLSEADILVIREKKKGIVALAKSLGVSYETLKSIRSGKSWKHI